MRGKLILEDGTAFSGELIKDISAVGEVVFNTGMTGYQEILTDPSYCRQLVTLTYPLIGNYGVSESFNQSRKSFVGGLIIGELCEKPSSSSMQKTLLEYLISENIPCIYEIDTRALTKKIRSAGTMKGIIVSEHFSQNSIERLLRQQETRNFVAQVTTPTAYTLEAVPDSPLIVAMDFGIKKSILKSLQTLNCKIIVVPAKTPAKDILALKPNGIFLSNGPGDPKDVPEIIDEIKKIIGKCPIFGICLGHQLIALAMGADTYKLKFGHRGSNQPVKNLRTNKVFITSQNHGYAVDENSLVNLPLEVTYKSLNDRTIEGLHHKYLPIYSVQYHPEAAPGPTDNLYLFDEFITAMKEF